MSNKRSLKFSIVLNLFANYSNVIIQIILSMFLARLLTPKEFGVAAIVLVFIVFFNLLSSMGLGPAIIQNKDLDDNDISTLFCFSFLIAVIFSAMFYLGSPILAKFYNNSEYVKIGRLLSLSIFFSTLNIVPSSLNAKRFKFKELGIVTLSVNVIVGILTIILAKKGFSFYSLIIKAIITSFFLFIANILLSKFKLKLVFNLNSIKKIIEYSSYQFLFNTINYFSRNLDSILIGKFMGDISLGFYDKAYRLMLYPVQNLTGVISPIMHPVLSMYQDDFQQIYNNYLKVIKLLLLLGIPLSVFLFFSSEEIIFLMYGINWSNSIPLFKILAITIWIQIILSSTGAIFQASNNTRNLFLSGSISAFFMCLGILYGILRKNLNDVCWGLLGAFSINFFQTFYFLIKKTLNQKLSFFFISFIKPILIGLFIILVMLLFPFHFDNAFLSLFIKLFISLLSFVIGLIVTKEYRHLLNVFKNNIA